MTARPLAEAAREMGLTTATLRRWVQQGAPTERPGSVGRNHGALVDPAALRRWRYGEPGAPRSDMEAIETIAQAFEDFFRRDSGLDAPAHRCLGIPDREAAALLVVLFEYVWQRLVGRELTAEDAPAQIARLRAICVNSNNNKFGGGR